MNETFTVTGGRGVLTASWPMDSPSGEVWRSLVDPGRLAAWFPARAEIDGDVITFRFPDDPGEPAEGKVTERVEGEVLAYGWGGDLLRWEVSGDGTLSLRHTFDDVPGAASFAAGWTACAAALRRSLHGLAPVENTAWAADHERFAAMFGLGEGVAEDDGQGWKVRFERQLPASVEATWAYLGEPSFADVGGEVPPEFLAPGLIAGPVTGVEAPFHLGYRWRDESGAERGDVRWELAQGTGGARLLLTQTGTGEGAETARLAWRGVIARLAAGLLSHTS